MSRNRPRWLLARFPCRRLLNWTPFLIIASMLAIQSMTEYRRHNKDSRPGRLQSKILDSLSNAWMLNCPRERAESAGPQIIPKYVSPDDIQTKYSEEQTLKALRYPLDEGGSWTPKHCSANHRVAIVIPFRNRHDQLPVLLHYLHPILQRQMLDYRVFVAEQWGNSTFNKALVMNIAYDTIRRHFPKYDCFIFHDVDMLPEDDRNGYRCGRFPRHLSSAVDEFNYTLPYPQIAGGVLAMTSDQFLRVNGYSNKYWGWGAEDDDMYYRIKASGMLLVRPSLAIGRYTMLRHEKRTRWNESLHLLVRALARVNKDGIAQLHSVPFRVMEVHSRLLYTHILVDVQQPPKFSSTPAVIVAADPVTEEAMATTSESMELEEILDKMRAYD